ncbi:hypothetical protein BLA60_24005 [Actinophytocola xinjiangensis]|uniref:DUF397 domain-containing protein n=1 Tax=Actinophytocola xinjiangensis TaxID=485602 RepID=A0A7Z0WJ29_9PSEU|nr:DUF397 domain-containing protein [Actinophytocola xinjiangensis]OLF08471.1 hypothetical protein BLA60_24005 [Actinophytocola xinjiangensis]
MRDTGWFKSGYSSAASDNCVEVRLTPGLARVRDSKEPAAGQLVLPASAFRGFLSGLR